MNERLMHASIALAARFAGRDQAPTVAEAVSIARELVDARGLDRRDCDALVEAAASFATPLDDSPLFSEDQLDPLLCGTDHPGTAPYYRPAAGGAATAPQRPALRAFAARMHDVLMPAERPRASRHVILFLAANPSGTMRLALDEECAAIVRELRMTRARHDLEFLSRSAVTPNEMMGHLRECRPTILHFSGHGARPADSARDPGIHFEGDEPFVGERALAQMIANAAPSMRLVVLNACSSGRFADSLCSFVDCVVGMTDAMSDDDARSFSVAFYRALGHQCSVGNAVAQATATLAAKRWSHEHILVCRTREGVDPNRLFLPAAPRRRGVHGRGR